MQILNTIIGKPATYLEKRIIAPVSDMDFPDYMCWHMKLLAVLCLLSIAVTQFACAKPVPVRFEYMDMV